MTSSGGETGSRGPAAPPASEWEMVGIAEFHGGSRVWPEIPWGSLLRSVFD